MKIPEEEIERRLKDLRDKGYVFHEEFAYLDEYQSCWSLSPFDQFHAKLTTQVACAMIARATHPLGKSALENLVQEASTVVDHIIDMSQV